MCFQIIIQKSLQNSGYSLMYLPGALAVTDPPELFWILIAQRRRWINGSNASFLYVFARCFKFCRTQHSFIKQFFFSLNFTMQIIQQLLGFISSGLFYGTSSIFLRSLLNNDDDSPTSIKITSAETPLQVSTWIENFLLTTFIFLVLICVTMGKALR